MSNPYANERSPPTAPTARRVMVWDGAVRLFHWALVLLFGVCSLTWPDAWMGWHIGAGTALLGLFLFRLMWGVWGSETARLAPLLKPPRAVFAHLAALGRGEPDHAVGHNPAGGLVVLLFLLLLLAEALSGIVVNNDIANESALTELMPAVLANAITALHGMLWYVLLGLVALHVAAVGFYELAKGHRLLRAMIRGWKTLPASVPAPRPAPLIRALLTYAAGFALAYEAARWL